MKKRSITSLILLVVITLPLIVAPMCTLVNIHVEQTHFITTDGEEERSVQREGENKEGNDLLEDYLFQEHASSVGVVSADEQYIAGGSGFADICMDIPTPPPEFS